MQWPPANATTSEGVSTDSGTANAATTEGVSTDSAARQWPPEPTRAPAASTCEAYRDLIVDALARGRNAVAIYQDLVDDHGFSAGYASVKRFVRKLRGETTPEARVVIATAPGEEGQVDYGEGPMVRDPETGKYRRTRLFVLTLAHSRKSVRLLTWRSSTQIWAELHERAFRRLGGAPKVIVLDNLLEGVVTPDIYDPTLNPLYRDMLAHYGVVALPCRVSDPDRKGKVEASVGHAQKTPLRGLRCESLEAAQAYLDRWETNWADTRIHGTTQAPCGGDVCRGETVFARAANRAVSLLQIWRAHRAPRRLRRGRGRVLRRAAGMDRPSRAGAVGRRARAHRRPDDGAPLARAPAPGAWPPPNRRRRSSGHTPSTTDALLRRARSAGRHIGALCAEIHRVDGEPGVRRVLGVLSLAKKHGAPAVDDAARAALDLGAPNYRFLRRHLERRPPAPLTLKQVDPLIRQLSLYRDLIQRRTEE